MRLSEYKKDFYDFSGKASDATRAAAFAGIALIWVFKIDARPAPRLPHELLAPTALFALGLACDLLQYVVGALIWGAFHLYHEKRLPEPSKDPEITHPGWFSSPMWALFVLKILSIIVAYGFVASYLRTLWIKPS